MKSNYFSFKNCNEKNTSSVFVSSTQFKNGGESAENPMLPSGPITALAFCVALMRDYIFWGGARQGKPLCVGYGIASMQRHELALTGHPYFQLLC